MSKRDGLIDEQMEAAITNNVGRTDDEMADAAGFARSTQHSRGTPMPTSQDNTLIASCPLCNTSLTAVFSVHLTDISIEKDGTIRSYGGGPMPESESDVIDLANESAPTISCEQGHVFSPIAEPQSTKG